MEVSAFRSLSVFLALSDVLRICELYVSFGSNVRPSILGFFTVGMTTLSMLSVSCVLYSAFCWVWGEEGAGCFVWVEMELVLLCP